jgi:predicted metal-dependent HD superfamily phosphohydrolase
MGRLIAACGADPARYAYTGAVRREFAHVPDALYRRGRSAFLKTMLDRPEVYLTAHFRERYEARARSNMAEELQRLGA